MGGAGGMGGERAKCDCECVWVGGAKYVYVRGVYDDVCGIVEGVLNR